MKTALTFPIPPSAPVVPCRSCKAPIVWIRTALGKRMPVNYERVNGCCPPASGTSHFATCPNASDWRKPR
jgi:hypothetical protein